ncbi:Arginyl-tRNA synthetase [Entomortierella lignicola]|nr:Arginyl-tRNA synthetase [Entomortierella lignicola]
MNETTLVTFRKVIAKHLCSVIGETISIETLLPLVQQNTGQRKASHSVFSVVIKRLATTLRGQVIGGEGEGSKYELDESLLEKCVLLSAEAQVYIGRARRTKDMLLFDPAPLQLIQLTIQNISNEVDKRKSKPITTTITTGKRGRGSDNVVIVNGAKIQADENAYSSLRRTILTGFVARFLKDFESEDSVKVITEHTRDTVDTKIKGLYSGLDLIADPSRTEASSSVMESHLNTIKDTIRTNKEIQAKVDENGAWTINLTSRQLGNVKLFSKSSNSTEPSSEEKEKEKEIALMEDPTLVVKTLVSLATQFSEYECDRYLWMVPDGRRQFVEQVLCLAKLIFGGETESNEDECSKETEGVDEARINRSRNEKRSDSWVHAIEVLYFGVATGVDIWKTQSGLSKGMEGIVEYTNVRMREIVVENRGRPGRGTGYGGDEDYDDADDDDEGGQVLDEAELTRMATILSNSALAFASVGGKRIRKLNVDMSRIMDGKGNSGVFLQYVQSRLCGIERKSKAKLNLNADLSLVQAYPEALNLCLVIAEWHDTLSSLQGSMDPYILVSHLFRLAAEIGQANRVLRVKDMESSVADSRWLLFWAAKQVLEHGLELLGLEFVDRM